MVAAGLAFAGLNVAVQWATVVAGASSPAVAFWQYCIALVLGAPLVWRGGVHILHTRHVGLHLVRVLLAAAGVQVWVYGLSVVPIWQAIALAMTSPFFVVAGAGLLLRERVDATRIAATVAGFAGAMVIIAPWSEAFTRHALLPILAAACWAGTSLITKYLTRLEPTAGITVYLLLLLTPVNALVWVGSGFDLPTSAAWGALLAAGALTALAQYLLTWAYASADAAYLQPFDDLKLPFNILAGWVVFGAAPTLGFWPGAALIVAASFYLMRREQLRS
ncbi:DMT family transporter [Nitratireductor mangrovi]|uniref:DMT family transporter n=2 Tax=Nitratireductor mangrovi TaxID=2599600 RepID=A0A5B8L5T0_9HYPH|nr:DMT family transporter [Nitratireductor mangrovi]